MNPAGAVIIYVLIWWCVFFAMLPVGVEGRWENESDGVEGADPGAPVSPDLKKKAIRTSLIALGLWIATVAIIVSGVVDFRD